MKTSRCLGKIKNRLCLERNAKSAFIRKGRLMGKIMKEQLSGEKYKAPVL